MTAASKMTPDQLKKFRAELNTTGNLSGPTRMDVRKALLSLALDDESFHPPGVDQLLADPPGWDGRTCDLCRSQVRIAGCGRCDGAADNVKEMSGKVIKLVNKQSEKGEM